MKAMSFEKKGLELSEDEAFALLGLCMTSPDKLDNDAEQAMRKLADFCRSRTVGTDHSINNRTDRAV